MNIFKKILVLSLILILSSGCGQDKTIKPVDATSASPSGQKAIVAGNMEPSLSIQQQNNGIVFTFTVKNQTEHVMTYNFNTSQTYDYIIKDAKGNIVKQYSKGRMFAQHTSTVHIKQGEALTYHDSVKNLPLGSYTMTIWLTANEGNPKVSQNFELI